MKILAIETSCDDTGVAILEANDNGNFEVLSNVIASQIEIHKQYGGVYPFMAKREHQKNLLPSLETALSQAKVSKKDVDLIAVTNGPGLEPCLWVGVNFAKDLAKKWNVPLVPVNHIESHILVNFLENKNVKFPAIALVVSGGHTQLVLMEKIGKYEILGETRDDAAGECFDKCAKILGLGYPGGPAIEKLASQWKSETNPKSQIINYKLPRPMLLTKDYDFSFSGLKTAVLYKWREIDKKDLPRDERQRILRGMCAEIQQSIIDVLLKKTIKAAKDYGAKTIILGGGVSANEELRKQFNYKLQTTNYKLNLLVPPANLSTDNAVMTAITGYFHRNKKIVPLSGTRLKADSNLRI
ncbi:MAG: tRNA (adenosine(37)-N6)-threonylcarbamoyltransferase complex transferase subunit TsaD [Candidatus Aenigmatarchaeota archaeon]